MLKTNISLIYIYLNIEITPFAGFVIFKILIFKTVQLTFLELYFKGKPH